MQAPPLPPASTEDLQQLKLLSIFHYLLAGMTALVSLMPLIHLAMGLAIITGALPMHSTQAQDDQVAPRMLGWIFVGVAVVAITFGMALAACMAYAGRCIARRRHHLFCLIVAGLCCMMMPLGTVLGVFTLVVLLRPQVKALFDAATAH